MGAKERKQVYDLSNLYISQHIVHRIEGYTYICIFWFISTMHYTFFFRKIYTFPTHKKKSECGKEMILN